MDGLSIWLLSLSWPIACTGMQPWIHPDPCCVSVITLSVYLLCLVPHGGEAGKLWPSADSCLVLGLDLGRTALRPRSGVPGRTLLPYHRVVQAQSLLCDVTSWTSVLQLTSAETKIICCFVSTLESPFLVKIFFFL